MFILKHLKMLQHVSIIIQIILWSSYEGWNFNSGKYLFTTDTK